MIKLNVNVRKAGEVSQAQNKVFVFDSMPTGKADFIRRFHAQYGKLWNLANKVHTHKFDGHNEEPSYFQVPAIRPAHRNTIKSAIFKVLEHGAICRDAFTDEVMRTVSEFTNGQEFCNPCTIHPVLKKMFKTGKVTDHVIRDDSRIFPLYISYDLTAFGSELARVSNYSLTR